MCVCVLVFVCVHQIASQRVSSVDLSCCSLEELPPALFYSQDLTHLNLKHNFMSPHRGLGALTRLVLCPEPRVPPEPWTLDLPLTHSSLSFSLSLTRSCLHSQTYTCNTPTHKCIHSSQNLVLGTWVDLYHTGTNILSLSHTHTHAHPVFTQHDMCVQGPQLDLLVCFSVAPPPPVSNWTVMVLGSEGNVVLQYQPTLPHGSLVASGIHPS